MPLLPSLDGLRAVAVAAVFLYHAGVVWMPGGFVGVEVFFVLSGYLITAGLWRYREDEHRLDVVRFWRRRARRLLPALAGVLLVVAGIGAAWFPDDIARVKGELLAACAYVSNWYLIGADLSYFSEMGRPSALRHLWSLAIEEQFYVLWPIVLFGLTWLLRRAWLVGTATLGLAALSVAVAWTMFTPGDDPSRVYYGTDTRASALLLGAGLALLWRPFDRDPIRRPSTVRRLDLAGLAGLAVIVWFAFRANEFDPRTYQGGIQAVALASAAVVAAGVHPGTRLTMLVLGGRVMQAIGRRSYSIYLWHWPVFVVTRPELDLPWSAGPVFALRVVLTAVLAELSYLFVELPIREGRVQAALARVWRRARTARPVRRQQILGSWSAVTTVAAVTLLAIAVSLVRSSAPPPAFASVALVDPPAATTTTQPAPPPPSVVTTVVPPPTTAPPPPPTRIVALGDSVLLGAAPAVQSALPGVEVDASVSRHFHELVGIVEARRAAGALGDALIIHIGTNGPPVGDQFERLLAAVADVPRVVLVTVKVPRRWEQAVNDAIRTLGPSRANVRLVDWHTASAGCPPDSFGNDGIHLRAPGAACFAGLLAQAVAAP